MLVSINCTAYNQEAYIRRCLDGFVMQKTNFPFEAIVHDDASTDKTATIIQEYAEKFPQIIKPIFEHENQWSKGNLDQIMLNACQGKYIAYCEGDDYWTDPYKLQKQVDFLETHPECSSVFGNFTVYDERNGFLKTMKFSKKRYVMFDVLSGLMPGLHNICIRREAFCQEITLSVNEDMQINYKCALTGQLAYIDENFSVYRITGKGVATSRSAADKQETAFSHWYQMHKELGFKYNRALAKYESYLVLGELFHNLNINYVSSCYKLLRKYSIDSKSFHFWRNYYALKYLFITFLYFILGKRNIYLKR